MLSLASLTTKRGIYKIDSEEGPVEVGYTHRVITGELQRELADSIIAIYSDVEKMKEESSKRRKSPATITVPKNFIVEQLTLVLLTLDIEEAPGKPIDPTNYDALMKVPTAILEGIHAQIMEENQVKKPTSTDSSSTTQETDGEPENLVG